jgi:cytoskeletal protein RodZ
MTSQPPRRRHSPAVYRRRRLVVLLVLILLIAGVWLLIAKPWASKAADASPPSPAVGATGMTALPVPAASTPSATSAATATPTPTATPSPTPTHAVAATAAPCTSANVTVDAVTDQNTYPSGQNPKLSIRLTNHGVKDCTMNVGTTTQKYTVTSGSDTWWRSTDCQSEPSDMVVLIKAGQTVQSATPLTWDRTRSSVSTCNSQSRPKAPGGGASYHLGVEIGGIASAQTAQFILY